MDHMHPEALDTDLNKLEQAVRSLHDWVVNLSNGLATQGHELSTLRSTVEGLYTNVGDFRRSGQRIVIDSCDLEVRDANLYVHTGTSSHPGKNGKGNLVVGKSHDVSMARNGLVSGTSNTIRGQAPTVLGGAANIADGDYSVVIAGKRNHAKGTLSLVTAGAGNCAEGTYSCVLGGQKSVARERHAVEIGSDQRLDTAPSSVTSIGGRSVTSIGELHSRDVESWAASSPGSPRECVQEHAVTTGEVSGSTKASPLRACLQEDVPATGGVSVSEVEMPVAKCIGPRQAPGGVERNENTAMNSGQYTLHWLVLLLTALVVVLAQSWLHLFEVSTESADLSVDSAAEPQAAHVDLPDMAAVEHSMEVGCVSEFCAQAVIADASMDRQARGGQATFIESKTSDHTAETQLVTKESVQAKSAELIDGEHAEQNFASAAHAGGSAVPEKSHLDLLTQPQPADASPTFAAPAKQTEDSQSILQSDVGTGSAEPSIDEHVLSNIAIQESMASSPEWASEPQAADATFDQSATQTAELQHSADLGSAVAGNSMEFTSQQPAANAIFHELATQSAGDQFVREDVPLSSDDSLDLPTPPVVPDAAASDDAAWAKQTKEAQASAEIGSMQSIADEHTVWNSVAPASTGNSPRLLSQPQDADELLDESLRQTAAAQSVTEDGIQPGPAIPARAKDRTAKSVVKSILFGIVGMAVIILLYRAGPKLEDATKAHRLEQTQVSDLQEQGL